LDARPVTGERNGTAPARLPLRIEEAMTGALLEARGLTKHFGSVEALRGADFTVNRNEVVALVGDNGAGKSTLVKILSGSLAPTAGTIRFDGRAVTLPTPLAARTLGIETVYQDLALAADLDPAANLFLGRELLREGVLGRLGVLDKRRMKQQARQAFESIGVQLLDQNVAVRTLSGGQRQGVAVGRSVTWASKVVLMDEPTAALGVVQTKHVLDVIRRVRDSGRSVVLISHNMPEVLEVADRIEVLRLGQRVARFDARTVSIEDVVAAMTGALTFHDDAEGGGE
jgi:simple sugar transport system ATP-binding protein